MENDYLPAQVEAEAQAFWETHHCFEASVDLNREKFYCLAMLPYPSGELHVGHVRNYTIADVVTRYQHMLGKNVLQPMGWDAFGLPAENAAIERKLPPSEWTRKNIKKMRKQLQQLGFAIDWTRELSTCDPEYYRWEQWLFLQLYEKGMAYKKNALVNWDPVDQTVLANEQVVDGKGWRSGVPVEKRDISQWFFKITDYAQELIDGLDQLTDWPDEVRRMQRNWIGRSEGLEIQFSVSKQKTALPVFTTRQDTLMGTTFIAIAHNHPLAKEATQHDKTLATFIKKLRKGSVTEADLATQEKEGHPTGFFAIHPLTRKQLPIWVTNYVLMDYGTGAVMGVPAHDNRDFELAQKYELPIQPVIKPSQKKEWDYEKSAYTDEGTLIHSGEFDGLKIKKAKQLIADRLVEKKRAEKKVIFRLRDWGISRQRYWGTPIPMIICKHCGDVPVPEADLPVVLPENLIPDGQGSPLTKTPEFYKVNCPQCGKAARRETDTMDTFVESSWYYARYTCPDQKNRMLDDRARYWTPINQYIGGIEHGVMHLLYARFFHKVLRDHQLLNSDEPFLRLLTQGMVLKDGSKMSKSKGNTVSPTHLIKKYGADTVRLFIIFAAPAEHSLEWSDSGIEGAHRFLKKLWQFGVKLQSWLPEYNQSEAEEFITPETEEQKNTYRTMHQLLQQANQDFERLQLNTIASTCMKLFNLTTSIDPNQGPIEKLLLREGIGILLCILSTITPHITHQLWNALGFGGNILEADWPKLNRKALEQASVEMIIQVNGKLRDKMMLSKSETKETIEKLSLEREKVQQHTEGKTIKRVIVVPGKLINIVVG